MTEKKGTFSIFVSTYHVPDIILGAGAIVVSKTFPAVPKEFIC